MKRKHNDPVNFPALSQMKDPNRFPEFVDVYYIATERIPKDSDLRKRLIKVYCYYAKTDKIQGCKNDAWRKEYFEMMSDIVVADPKLFALKSGIENVL